MFWDKKESEAKLKAQFPKLTRQFTRQMKRSKLTLDSKTVPEMVGWFDLMFRLYADILIVRNIYQNRFEQHAAPVVYGPLTFGCGHVVVTRGVCEREPAACRRTGA